MKIKTSVTLSNELLNAIDTHMTQYRSRSAFLEAAARDYLASLAKRHAEQRDLEIINRRAGALNAETEDVLAYQGPI